LDPDQLSLQAPFPEGLAAPMSGSPMARQLAPGVFMLRSGQPACGPVSLLAQEAGRFYRRFPPALLFGERPQDLSGSYSSGKKPCTKRALKMNRLMPTTKAIAVVSGSMVHRLAGKRGQHLPCCDIDQKKTQSEILPS
jgi:hypothetical protein